MNHATVSDEPVARDSDGNRHRNDVPYDVIAQRAYEIWESGEGGSAKENWERAAAELGAEPRR
ncbi:MAG TPA: hypothetical protein VEY87_10090 [Gaiellaceae bacterium]|nr:hypothetical protein [Gaiellaceae bacterium]